MFTNQADGFTVYESIIRPTNPFETFLQFFELSIYRVQMKIFCYYL